MKNLIVICGVGFLLLCSCSKATERSKPTMLKQTASSEETQTYSFKLTSVVPDKNHKAMGKFNFRHIQSKPIRVHGFWFADVKGNPTESSTAFRVRFETFKRKESGTWVDVPVGYCGTGAQEYQIQPNQDYTFLIPLWPFVERGTHGIIGLSGTETTVESEPFETSEIQKIAKLQKAASK